MDTRFWETTILWIHAGSGAIWIGACACFVIAGLALASGSVEQRNFAVGAAPKIDRLAMLAAGLLFATGLLNLYIAGLWRGVSSFSTAFITVLAIKIGLFIAMVAAMHWSMRIGAAIKVTIENARSDALSGEVSRMVKAHAAVVAMGSIALMLGLWLMGT